MIYFQLFNNKETIPNTKYQAHMPLVDCVSKSKTS